MKPLPTIYIMLVSLVFSTAVMAGDIALRLDDILQGPQRDVKNAKRDIYRHPKETLIFFGLKRDMQVLEILPGRGWYTEILAPLLKDTGELTVASFGDAHPHKYLRGLHIDFIKMMNAKPDSYGKVKVALFDQDGYLKDIPDNSMDMVVTFRNTHNWIRFGGIEAVYAAFNRVLKPGGVLGVVQHRAHADGEPKVTAEKGYVPESYLINLVENSGFQLLEKSEINANSADSKDYPEGVWSLPPTYREEDKNRDRYTAIGESDRMTMKFVKK